MKRKNDYSCIAFFEHSKPKKWRYVHKLDGFVRFLDLKHKGWKYCNVYDRRHGTYLKRFYPGGLVPPFLALFFAIFLSRLGGPLNSTFSTAFGCSPNGIYNSATILTSVVQKMGGQWRS